MSIAEQDVWEVGREDGDDGTDVWIRPGGDLPLGEAYDRANMMVLHATGRKLTELGWREWSASLCEGGPGEFGQEPTYENLRTRMRELGEPPLDLLIQVSRGYP
jgi:hypothetical protein